MKPNITRNKYQQILYENIVDDDNNPCSDEININRYCTKTCLHIEKTENLV